LFIIRFSCNQTRYSLMSKFRMELIYY
jgi:hypothetical protein